MKILDCRHEKNSISILSCHDWLRRFVIFNLCKIVIFCLCISQAHAQALPKPPEPEPDFSNLPAAANDAKKPISASNDSHYHQPKPKPKPLPKIGGLVGGLVGGIVIDAVIDKADQALDYILNPDNHEPKKRKDSQPEPGFNLECKFYGESEVFTSIHEAFKSKESKGFNYTKWTYLTSDKKAFSGQYVNDNNVPTAYLHLYCTEAVPKTKPSYNPNSEPAPKPEPSPKPNSEPAPKPNSEPAPKPNSEPAPKPNSEPAPKPNSEPAPKPNSEPAPKPNSEPAPKPNSEPAPKPEPSPKPNSEPAPKPEPSPKPNSEPSTDDKPQKFELPDFCDWATRVCTLADFIMQDPDLAEPEPAPTKEIELKNPSDFDKDYVNANAQCPNDIVKEFTTGFQNEKITFSFTPICDFAHDYLRPVILFLAYFIATITIASAFKVE